MGCQPCICTFALTIKEKNTLKKKKIEQLVHTFKMKPGGHCGCFRHSCITENLNFQVALNSSAQVVLVVKNPSAMLET